MGDTFVHAYVPNPNMEESAKLTPAPEGKRETLTDIIMQTRAVLTEIVAATNNIAMILGLPRIDDPKFCEPDSLLCDAAINRETAHMIMEKLFVINETL